MERKKPASSGSRTATSLEQEMAEDAATVTVAPDRLKVITDKARELFKLQVKLVKLSEQSAEVAKQIRALKQDTLPALMDEAGIPRLSLASNVELVREEQVYASISEANQQAATEWLIQHDFGAIVKARIVVDVEKGDTAILEATRKALVRAKVGFEETSGVHASTLKAFVREQLAAGTKLPKSITYHVQPVVDVKVAKAKK
jgi:hypothetical protein